MQDAVRILDEAICLTGGREYAVDSVQVLELVRESRCSVYDCEFVALSRDLGVCLVTVHKQILRAFPREAVSLEAFVGD